MVCTIVYLYLCTMLHGCDNDFLQDSLLQSVKYVFGNYLTAIFFQQLRTRQQYEFSLLSLVPIN